MAVAVILVPAASDKSARLYMNEQGGGALMGVYMHCGPEFLGCMERNLHAQSQPYFARSNAGVVVCNKFVEGRLND